MTSREVSEQTLLMIGMWLKTTAHLAKDSTPCFRAISSNFFFQGILGFGPFHVMQCFGFWSMSLLPGCQILLFCQTCRSLQDTLKVLFFVVVESVPQRLQHTQSGALGITFQNNPSSNMKSWCDWTHLNPKYLLIANLTKEQEELKQNKVQKQGTEMVSWLTDL